MWWCPVCKCEVPGEHVTYEETHDPRFGGCGSRVGDKPEIDLNPFIKWVNQGKRRKAHIELESNKKPYIYVFDFDVAGFTSQNVDSAEQIDMEGVAAAEERKQYERLKAKFEPVPELPQPDLDDIALDEVALNIENHKIKPPQKELPQSA